MLIYKAAESILVEENGGFYDAGASSLDSLINHENLYEHLRSIVAQGNAVPTPQSYQAPVGSQEIWASGVTYYRSRNARMEESKDAGGGDFYDRVYYAERPELFFKAPAHRVVAPQGLVRIREDATWSVPEPELTLVINARAEIVGYTIGNDMSSRDIEGTNPLYLPQAKVYNGSCAIGPAILIQPEPMPSSTEISIEIQRSGAAVFTGATTLAEMKRDPKELVEYLYRELDFPQGAFLLTGTGVVPPDSFTLHSGDRIAISIASIGTLVNSVA
ncbi:MAG TPA: fumarylacetoacetate hydrolase family protein [Acidobacteriaceae bacterium]